MGVWGELQARALVPLFAGSFPANRAHRVHLPTEPEATEQTVLDVLDQFVSSLVAGPLFIQLQRHLESYLDVAHMISTASMRLCGACADRIWAQDPRKACCN